MDTIQALILAAGKSHRFGAACNKLIIPLCGRPLIMHSITLLERMHIPSTIIIGHEKEMVRKTINDHATSSITYALQETQQGTGHAVMCSRSLWHTDHILIVNGDMPLISESIIDTLYKKHSAAQATVSFVTALPDTNTHAYGRVIHNGPTIQIIEAADFTGDSTSKYPINAGIYLFERSFLEETIDTLTTQNASNEFYLTDLIAIASNAGLTVNTVDAPFDYIRGVNTKEDWCIAQEIKRMQIINYWMQYGVRILLPHSVQIDDTVSLGHNVCISAGVHLLGNTRIGDNCIVEPYSIIQNSSINDHSIIHSHSSISDAVLDSHTAIGPFARIRTNSHIKSYAEVGNFVEIKQSHIGSHTKAKHLTYLGDTTTGSHVNVGAGTITCNYDGTEKHGTTINDNAFIGSNNTLIAPLTIGDGAYTAAGSTITEDVPSQALALGRSKQINKLEYAQKIRDKNKRIKSTPITTSSIE